MAVKVRPWKRGGFQVDVRFRWPDRTICRDRRVLNVKTEAAARRWGEARESELRAEGQVKVIAPEPMAVMTVAELAPLFVADYARADGHGEGGIEAKESILRIHIVPHIGTKRLDKLDATDVQTLKRIWREGVADKATGKVIVKPTAKRKTLNNRLTVLSMMLKVAVDWKARTGLQALPVKIETLKGDDSEEMAFYEHHELDALVEGAMKSGPEEMVTVLLGADAGLRRGEILGAQWTDVVQGKIHIQRQVYAKKKDGGGRELVITPTKGKAKRWVPLSPRLVQALQKHRHLRAPWLFCQEDGSRLTPKMLKLIMQRAERRAGLAVTGRVHVLRHTYCSHLAMAGASPITIQTLAGHQSLETTMRYMHLSPNAADEAVRLLVESRQGAASRGNIVATAKNK